MSWLLTFLTGGTFSSLTRDLMRAYELKLQAKNDVERIKAEKEIAVLEARIAAQTHGAGSWIAKAVRAAFALPFILYNGKLIIWDKMLGWGTTDPLSVYLETVGWIVVGFYFFDNTVRLAKR